MSRWMANGHTTPRRGNCAEYILTQGRLQLIWCASAPTANRNDEATYVQSGNHPAYTRLKSLTHASNFSNDNLSGRRAGKVVFVRNRCVPDLVEHIKTFDYLSENAVPVTGRVPTLLSLAGTLLVVQGRII